ncbi:hypothetical protein ARAM_006371 [Aspergillus rambellii]|uniref:Uncharacterized protein n=1 Tax=Aspergillus rambellii TaxID=308745 RepID=A0A0F8U9J6_9EURO|nr:hypothetical protein ARAM_006371 [Aspergillus rambellii]
MGLITSQGPPFEFPIGVVIIGLNMAVYVSANISIMLSAHLQAEVNSSRNPFDLSLSQYHQRTSASSQAHVTYSIGSGVNVGGQLNAPTFYNWGGTTQVPIASVPRKQIMLDTCAGSSTLSKRAVELLDGPVN